MWKWLHPYAKADRAYQLCNTLLPYFAVVTVVCMIVGWVWGLAYAPADYQQKDSYRIILKSELQQRVDSAYRIVDKFIPYIYS